MGIFERVKNIAKNHEAKYSYEELLQIREDENKVFIKSIEQENNDRLKNSVIGRSGILPIHQNCTVENFIADTPAKQNVKEFAANYIANFPNNQGGGFIFSGQTGTGKNHLSAAICNAIMPMGYTCLIITVDELMQKLRASYGGEGEDKFFKTMIAFDLLVLDEIGLQRKNTNEKLAINQIIDQRIGRLKPTGMLTNMDAESEDPDVDTMKTVVGARILSRMRMNGGKWKSFNWEDYRYKADQ